MWNQDLRPLVFLVISALVTDVKVPFNVSENWADLLPLLPSCWMHGATDVIDDMSDA